MYFQLVNSMFIIGVTMSEIDSFTIAMVEIRKLERP
jgi:hypothetical protein